ncbi:hypothetical protein N7492_005731 [Penicillium capsulatum]|uniref:AB hydrolase-1 domain-containing protein n=1 Tax=Penicillium capsulatum TaxID=69766 RepID=A0A9W9LSE9_9EURO|nr:hypothetical protein N7492_005731 [Penicillium capsulatum]KAJ6135171.1 hypothetical protein N7512_000331 [Penicillium capsulatum]
MASALTVLPRPTARRPINTPWSIHAPTEASFTSTFGNLLPPASFVNTGNGRAAYYELLPTLAEDQSKSPSRIMLIHGVQTPAIGLQPLASALASRLPHAHFVLLDLWGHGLTGTPFVAHEPAIFHSLLASLMGKLGWQNAHFIGYSFGGSTTASFAAKHPEYVRSMVLVAPAGLIRSAQFNEVQMSYLQGGEGLEDRARDWILEFLEGGQLVVPADWTEKVRQGQVVAEAVRDWENREHEGHLASVVGIFRDGGVLDQHAAFAAAAAQGIPSLSILGELDDLCSVQDLYDVGMNHVAVVPQVGHGVVRQKVPEVTQLIVDFWGKI